MKLFAIPSILIGNGNEACPKCGVYTETKYTLAPDYNEAIAKLQKNPNLGICSSCIIHKLLGKEIKE